MKPQLDTSEEELVLLIIKRDSKTKPEIRELLNEATQETTITLNLTLEILRQHGYIIELEAFPPQYQITAKGREALMNSNNVRIRAEGRIRCVDCGGFANGIFMVTNELWESLYNKKDFACIDCFLKKLGRNLTIEDLKPEAGINKIVFSILGKSL